MKRKFHEIIRNAKKTKMLDGNYKNKFNNFRQQQYNIIGKKNNDSTYKMEEIKNFLNIYFCYK